MRYFVCLCILFLLSSCNNEENIRKNASDFILPDAETIYHIGSLEAYKNAINNNETFKNLFKVKDASVILNNLNTNKEIILSLQDSSRFTLITKTPDSSFFKPDTSFKEAKGISKFSIENTKFFTVTIDSFLIISPDKKSILETINNKDYISVTSSNPKNNSTLNIFLKLKDSGLKNTLNLFGNSLNLDINASEKSILFSGISKTTDSGATYFINQIPKEHKLLNVIPEKSNNVSSFTVHDFNTFLNNYTSTTNNEELFDLISNIGTFTLKKSSYVLHTIDIESTKAILFEDFDQAETYRDIEIITIQPNSILKQLFSPFNLEDDKLYGFNIKDAFIFSSNKEDAKKIITDFKNDISFKNSTFYKSIKDIINDESSFLYLNHDDKIDPNISTNFSKIFTKELSSLDLKTFNNQVLQITSDNGFCHVNGFIKAYKAKAKRNSITEEYSVALDTDILNNPQFVKNHITKQKDIAIQDIENNLYVFSNSGKLRWKKQLQGPILGKIEQIDMYKNGRLQLAFATPKRIYIIDRKGKDVSPFPKTFNDNITQPLSVFDYDNKKNYRLMVTQGKSTIMYDSKGKQVKGFLFKSANNIITSQPKHFRISSKDFIVFKTKNKPYILNRRGQIRIKTSSSFNFSNNEMFLYKNRFTTTDSNGKLVQIDTRGKLTSQDLSLIENHFVKATSKTLVSLNDNILTIRGKSIELDFGDYTQPEIFYLNDKIYVSVTDLQTQKVYLFDSQAKFISNFPIYGNSSIDLSNIDTDKSLELITKSDNNSLVIYKIN